MANTYTLIASNTLSSSAASVTFSAIPNTYTDLVLKLSLRMDAASASGTLRIELNADTSSIYSSTILRGDGTSASSLRTSAIASVNSLINGATTTSNTFSSHELYLPSYTASQNKAFSIDGAHEDNLTLAYRQVNAALYASTNAISQIRAYFSAGNFVSGSSFFLYGIKNS